MAFELSVELTGKIDSFRKSFVEATKVVKETDDKVSELTKNISQNIAAFDRLKVSNFISSLRKVNPVTKEVTESVSKMGVDVEKNITEKMVKPSARGSNEVSKNLAKIAASADNMGGKVAVGSNRAGMALTDLGRIAQDAPYGFIGIQNNINPLIESFGRLKAETGSTGGALKALAGSLIGPAGFGLALSAISAAILLYNQYQQKAAKETANSESAMKKAKKTAEEYALSLDEVTRANLIGSQNAARELVDLKLLYDTTQNLTLSTKLRADAVDTLQEKYPSYFKNIKDENILNGQAEDVYNKLTVAILASSKARAAGDIMAENDKRNFANIQKRNDLEVQYGNIVRELNVATEKQFKLNTQSNGREGSALRYVEKIKDLESQRSDVAEQIRGYKRDEEIITGRNLKLSGAILDFQKQGAEIDGKVGGSTGTKERAKDVKTLSDVLAELDVSIIQIDNSFQTTFGERANDKIKSYQKAIDELIKMGYAPASKAVGDLKKAQQGLFQLPSIGKSPDITPKAGNPVGVQGQTKDFYNLNAITDEQEKILRSQIKFNEDFNSLISNGLTSGISGLANAFGEVLANGGNAFEALGASLLGSLGGVLTQLGEMAIGVGVGLVAIKKALQSLNPVVAIAAGVALVALGGYVSAKASSIGGGIKGGNSAREATAFANGGIISGPTLGLMGEYAGAKNNPEVVAPLSKLSDMIGASKGLSESVSKNVISTLSNSRNVVASAGNIQNAMGERSEVAVLVPDMKLVGEDIYVSFNRVQKRLGRV